MVDADFDRMNDMAVSNWRSAMRWRNDPRRIPETLGDVPDAVLVG